MKQVTRIRVIDAAFGPDGRPTIFRGIVMHGAKMVASTRSMRNKQACLCIAETLRATYNVSQRAQ